MHTLAAKLSNLAQEIHEYLMCCLQRHQRCGALRKLLIDLHIYARTMNKYNTDDSKKLLGAKKRYAVASYQAVKYLFLLMHPYLQNVNQLIRDKMNGVEYARSPWKPYSDKMPK